MATKKKNDISRTLIEAFVCSKLKGIINNPDRSLRSMIDMGSHFAKGQSQKHFFEELQNIMADENGNYYKLLQNIVTYVDANHLLTFGLNIGYNSLTSGVKTIRYIEDNKGVEVPWVISLSIDGSRYDALADSYQLLIEQGKRLGIYTWVFYTLSEPHSFLPLIQSQPECAFLLFVDSADVTEDFLDEANRLKNLLVVVKYGEDCADICAQMREREMLYSVYVTYTTDNLDTIIEDELLYDISELHPGFTFFLYADGDDEETGKCMFQYVQSIRYQQKYATIPFDLDGDNMIIQDIVAANSCKVSFDENGYLYKKGSQTPKENSNVFKTSLAKVLLKNFRIKEVVK
ncbi:MAG: hypothetical protein LUF92_04735 [Clostridiales bacterium]|nr:hypothetical protein [Clostridiales bacterium]